MRSVTVVLPASMCAMMPMLRTFLRSVRTSCATCVLSSRSRGVRFLVRVGQRRPRPRYAVARVTRTAYRSGWSPAVVREGLVGLGHLVGVLAALDSGTEAVAGVEELVHQPLGHGLLAPLARVAHQPAQRQRGRPAGAD